MPKRKKRSEEKPDEGVTESSFEDELDAEPNFSITGDVEAVGDSIVTSTLEPAATEPEPKPEAGQWPDPTPESPPEPLLPRITLKVFERVAGAKWDQLAGFKSYAKAQALGPMTVPEWREALQAFRNKPTNPKIGA